ncbi:hypothetical protein K438DRAFT_1983687 [Mycena galopus ATCC 62051]|nr:hypothetical protein K438DRAFT_1983687 [Mycena galopus ATCC 62051]
MPRTTTIIFKTLGGSPVFHVPFPISTLPALAGVPGDDNEDVKLVFRNRRGRPTFHVGGAEIGVSPADAWDSATVIHGRKAKAEQGGAEGTPQVRVKVEEGTPRTPAKRNGKGKERQERVVEQGSSKSGESFLRHI